MRTAVAPLAIIIALLLALRNLRLGRGDRRGALRLSMFLLAAGAVSNVLANRRSVGAQQRARRLSSSSRRSRGCCISRSNRTCAASGLKP